jgi:hypothetical protein
MDRLVVVDGCSQLMGSIQFQGIAGVVQCLQPNVGWKFDELESWIA